MKNSMKKILMLIAVVVTVIVSYAVSASALDATGKCGDNAYYTYDADTGTVVISGSGPMYDYEIDYYRGYAGSLFKEDSKYITSVIIEDGITYIGDNAFFGCSLDSVTIGSDVTDIGDDIRDCYYLKNITVDENNPIYSSDASGVLYNKDKTTLIRYPRGKEATSYTIPDFITSVGDSAFDNCYNLESVIIPGSVTSLGYRAFYNCSNLTDVTIGKGVTNLGIYTFDSCENLKNVIIPDSVTCIGVGAFRFCYNLESITIPDSVTSIDAYAFEYCALKSITIPDSVTSLGNGAFYNCSNLTDVTIGDGVTNLDADDLFIYCSVKRLTLGKNVKKLCASIFRNYYDFSLELEEIHVPDLETWLQMKITPPYSDSGEMEMFFSGVDLYFDGKLLTDLVIPEGIDEIKAHAFNGYYNLKSVVFPDGVKNIKAYAFYNCKNLATITFPDGITSIDSSAFMNCHSLKSIIIPDLNSWLQIDFGDYYYAIHEFYNGVFHAGADLYIDGELVTDIVIPEGTTKIYDCAFEGNNNLKTVTIPTSVTYIGEGSFDSCKNLIDIYYKGSKAQWESIEGTEGYRNNFSCATIHYAECSHLNKINKAQQDATCTAIGYTEGVYCPDCEKWLSGHSEINALGHSFTEKIIDTKHLKSAATYTSPAVYKYDCANCNAISNTLTFKYGNALALGKPSKVTATQTTNSIKLSWSAVAGAEKYNVYRMISGNWKLIGTTAKLEYTFNNLSAGTKYSFAVRAVCTVNGKSTLSTTYSTFDTATKPVAAKVTVTPGQTTIKLTWPKCAGATGYRIFYKKGNEWKIKVNSQTATSFTYTGLTKGTKYTFTVRPYIKVGSTLIWADFSDINTATKPVTVPKITAKQTTSSITLSWSASAGATGYRIYTKSGSSWKSVVNSTAATTYTFKINKPGTKYTFAVRPYIKNGNTVVWGDMKQFTTAALPSAPTPKVASPSKGKVTVTWNAVNGAELYQVYYKIGNGNYKLYKTYTSVQKLNFNIKSGSNYTFTVRAGIKTSSGNILSNYKGVAVTVK